MVEVPAGLNSYTNLKKIIFVDDLYGFILDRNINLFKTSNGGASWSKIYINLSANLNNIKFLDRLTGFITGDNMAIFKTTDGGLTWNRKTQNDGYSIVGLHFFNEMQGYAFTSGSLTYPVRNVYYTSDRGETWSEKDSMPAFSFVDFFNKQNGMALISGGYSDPSITIAVSRDGGEWQREDLPIPLTGTFMKMADPSTAYIFGQNGTIIRFKDMSYTSIEEETGAEIINDYSLSQNYPNPFNPETIIKFSLPEAGFVKGVVYDILGREVRTLINGEMNPGNHEVKFDAKGIASGVYIFRLEAGRYSSAIKMVVNK
ncbi:MAG: T9SS type A sorting domain-containing protein [Ignavibacteriales bacterium]|nr:T9SS type A sorting domain-containing protein [Ignavibacteriales bacterium]